MRLYMDDNCTGEKLVGTLRDAGHDVRLPEELGVAGRNDQVHLLHAVREGRVLLTKDYDDFEEMHDLVMEVQGHHPGILVVRQDNDRQRDMEEKDIKRALQKMEAANFDTRDQYMILNHWR